MFAMLRPKILSRTLLPVWIMMPLGTTAAAAMVRVGIFGAWAALLFLIVSVVCVYRAARRWLKPLPFVRASTWLRDLRSGRHRNDGYRRRCRLARVGCSPMTQPCLELRHLQAAYGERVVLDDISLTLAKGEWFVLLGPNGCGKSTLLDCVAGRKTPSAGSIEICGHSLTNDSVAAKMRMGYGCAPEVLPPLLTARQCLEIHAAAKRLSSVGEDLLELADELRFTPYWNSFVDILSLDWQKLAVLLALVGDPKLILLDEAFNGLDPESAQILKRSWTAPGSSVAAPRCCSRPIRSTSWNIMPIGRRCSLTGACNASGSHRISRNYAPQAND